MTEKQKAIKLADRYEEQGYIDIYATDNKAEFNLIIKYLRSAAEIINCSECKYQKDCHHQIRQRKLNAGGTGFEVSMPIKITSCSHGERITTTKFRRI